MAPFLLLVLLSTRQAALLLAGQEPGWRSPLLPKDKYPANAQGIQAMREILLADFLAVSEPPNLALSLTPIFTPTQILALALTLTAILTPALTLASTLGLALTPTR